MKLLPADDRPREKLIEHGPDILSNSELLAILIRTGTPQRSALDIARELTDDDGFYSNIAKARSVADLSKIKGLGPAKAATILAAVELGRRVAGAQPQKKIRFSSPEACVNFLMPRLRYEGNEKFVVMLLDSKNQLIKCSRFPKVRLMLRWCIRVRYLPRLFCTGQRAFWQHITILPATRRQAVRTGV